MLRGQRFYDSGEYEKCIASLSKSKYKYEEKVLLLMAVSYRNLHNYDETICIIEQLPTDLNNAVYCGICCISSKYGHNPVCSKNTNLYTQ
ncbi:hypothetical protein [Pectinatus frisingensis]|uniref:hypothetical protein n=1 Tax=Pectinatus frisingensis TaxID=865 RepID=UPI0018C68E21|nr:hypothetical protein [Pectinatus frisingensis]